MPLTSHGSRGQSEVHEQGVHAAPATTLSTGLKHTRQRSNSVGATTFYTSTIVPAPFHNEALSSLISSLTSISDAQKAATHSKRPNTGIPPKDEAGVLINRLAGNPEFQRAFAKDKTVPSSGTDNEQDVCPPPVAGYNTINADPLPGRPKTACGEGHSLKLKIKKARGALRSSQSQGNIKSKKSRRNLKTPDSNSSVPPHPRSSHGDDSVYSVALSTNSKHSTGKNSFKMFFSSRLGSDHHHDAHEGLPKMSGSSFETPPSLPEKEPDARRFSAFVAVSRISTDIEGKDANGRAIEPMSPLLRTDLSENVIPSRRSSLRGGHGRRSSRSSRDLKRLDIDEDLIEENNETVQRIRELQEARERRHHEWRKDAAKSERPAAKRGSLPSASSSPSKHAGSVRSSWRPTMLETPEDEDQAQLSASILGSDLPDMSAYSNIAATESPTPVEREKRAAEETELRRKLSQTGSITPSLSSAKRHRKRFSDSIRRASLRSPMPDDAKGITDEVESYLSSPRLSQKIRHPRTGRTIAFSEVGDPDGFAVFCCVGMGLTRYVSSFYDDIARTHRLRIITPDRPGVGETDALPQERAVPLSWVDDVAVICTSLGIEKFSLLAHSAGAIYALATALKMPQYVRGRIHLLGPWIPPSVLAASGRQGDVKAVNLPTTHKILSILPASFMKAANSRFLSATSASIEPRVLREGKKDRASVADLALDDELFNQEASLSTADFTQGNMFPTPDASPNRPTQNASYYQVEQMRSPQQSPTPGSLAPPRPQTFSPTAATFSAPGTRAPSRSAAQPMLTPEARQKLYNTTLAHRTWSLATLNANPAVDLIICLERKKPIGFRYTDITRAVVIHHGANDTRVPLENVRWLSAAMKRCELRVLETEGHGLMASASVMANVLAEIGKEWEEWNQVVQEKEKERKRRELAEKEEERERERAFRRGYPRW